MQEPESPDTNKACTPWAWVELVVEIKLTHTEAGFHFTGDELLRDSEAGRRSRAQLVQYATKIMHHQHRTHLFMVLITKHSARLFRWDRTGVLMSKPINLLKYPRQLLDFIYRFGQMTPEQRGHDPSATLINDHELLRAFEEHEPTDDWARECKKSIMDSKAEFPLYQVRAF